MKRIGNSMSIYPNENDKLDVNFELKATALDHRIATAVMYSIQDWKLLQPTGHATKK